MMTRLSDAENEKQRAEKQSRLKNLDRAKERYSRAVEALKQARVPVAEGKLTRLSLVPYENEVTAAAQELNLIMNSLPNELINSSRNREQMDDYEVARSLLSVARADHARTVQTLKSENDSLAILISGISNLIGPPAVIAEDDPMPWDQGVIAKTFTAMQIAFGKVTVAKWAISQDRQSIAFSPEIHETNVQHYAKSWRVALRDVRLAQASHDESAQRLAEVQAAFDEAKSAMIWSPI